MGTGLGLHSRMMAFLQVTIVRCSLMFLFDDLALDLSTSRVHRIACQRPEVHS